MHFRPGAQIAFATLKNFGHRGNTVGSSGRSPLRVGPLTTAAETQDAKRKRLSTQEGAQAGRTNVQIDGCHRNFDITRAEFPVEIKRQRES